MRIMFNEGTAIEWLLTDDTIITKKKTIALSSVREVENTEPPKKASLLNCFKRIGTISLWIGSGAFDVTAVAYTFEDIDKANRAIEYIKSIVKQTREKGFRKRCKVCGKIMCYSFADLDANERLGKSAVLSSLGGIAGALSGNYAAGATNNQTAADETNRMTDYSKCPSCGSRELEDINDEDIERINSQQNAAPSISSADELKKFKELLDSGVITQEEFDQKKKQLLGL